MSCEAEVPEERSVQSSNYYIYCRLVGCPVKWEFLKNGMNLVDVLAILPYYVELGMSEKGTVTFILLFALISTVKSRPSWFRSAGWGGGSFVDLLF